MKRLNRLNFTLYISIIVTIQLGLIFGMIELKNQEILILEIVMLILLASLSIFGLVLIVKRSHDFGSRGGKHIFGVMLIPFYIIYLALKKGDKGENQFGDIDTTILFWDKDNVSGENIFEMIFYSRLFGPAINKILKEEIVKSKKGRLGVLLYPIIYLILCGIMLFIVLVVGGDSLNNTEFTVFCVSLFLGFIPYKFILPLFISIYKLLFGGYQYVMGKK